MHTIMRPNVVLLAAFALVLVGAGAFMARLDGASAAGGGPEMRLTANGCTAACTFETGESFTLAVDIVTAPAAGYIVAQSFIDYGDDLLYDIDGQPAEDEIVWADLDTRVALRASFGAGLIYHGGESGLIPPQPVSTATGNFVEIKMTCSADDTSTQVDLLPLGDQQTVTSGTAFVEGDDHTQVTPKVSGLLIHCGAGGPLDTPTPTATQTFTPAPVSIEPPILTQIAESLLTPRPTPRPASTPGSVLIPPPLQTRIAEFLSRPTPTPGGPTDATTTIASIGALPSTGDGTCSNTFDAIDATLVLQLHARLIPPSPCPRDSDVNGDGRTDSRDALLLVQFNAGLIATLPP